MSKKSVFCIATSRNQADQIVDQLKTAGFSNNDISALFADKGTDRPANKGPTCTNPLGFAERKT